MGGNLSQPASLTSRPAAARVRLRTGTARSSHTPACPAPPRNSPLRRAPGPPGSAARSPGRRPFRWSPGPRHTHAAPWRSRPPSPALPEAGGCWPHAGSDPRHSRSRAGIRHCYTGDLTSGGKGIMLAPVFKT